MLPLLLALALAAPRPDGEPALGPLSATLAREADAAGARPVRAALRLAEGADPAAVRAAVAAIPGATVEVEAAGHLQVLAPGDALRDIARVPGLTAVRRPYLATPKRDPIPKSLWTSEGVAWIGADAWHDLGLRGDGQRVAILDIGFQGLRERFGGQVPRRGRVHRYFGDTWRLTSHGTSVAEIIHDVAPRAELALYDFQTDVEFLAACDLILSNGERIVNASIGFDNLWHADGTSPWTRKVDELAAAGVLWVAAAGNEADIYWIGTPTDLDGDGWLEFGGTERLPVTAWDGAIEVRLRWDEPMGGASMDLDLFVGADTAAATYDCGAGVDEQDGASDPIEWVGCSPPQADGRTTVSVFDYSGRAVAEGVTVFLYVARGDLDPNFWTLRQSLTLPGDAAGALSVGALDVTEGDLAWYSSHGPTDDGRLKPDLVAPSHVTTATDDPFVFTGSSAAAPHAAGAAALVAQASGGAWSPAQIRAFLTESARDEGPPGPDTAWGHGVLTLGEPPAGFEAHAVRRGACGCASSSFAGGVGWVAILALGAARRRRR